MLNQDLIKQFKHIKEKGLTGVLGLQDTDRVIRYYFEAGSLLLLDFGLDKEVVIADQFLKHYKIDDAMAQYAKTVYQDKQVAIAETLLKQQLVSQGEIDQVTRAMVEDILCYTFGSRLTTSWQNEADVDIASFDLNKSAVKIRIDIDMLLTMVQSRIQEREAVEQRISNWDTVYSNEEGAPPDSQLNEMERNVLHFVDGRASAKDIARSLRESNINVGIYLCSLENQGFIRKGGIRSSTRIAVSASTEPAKTESAASNATTASAAPAATAAAPQADPFGENDGPAEDKKNFEVYTASHVRNEQSSSLSTVVLIVILVVTAGVSWLVYSRMQAEELQEQRRNQISEQVARSNWSEAERLLKESIDLYRNDRVGLKKLRTNVGLIQDKITNDLDAIQELIDVKDYKAAEGKLEAYPRSSQLSSMNELWSDRLGDQLRTCQSGLEALNEEIISASTALAENIRVFLRTSNIQFAVDKLNNKPEAISDSGWSLITDKARQVMRTWRDDLLSEVASSGDTKSSKWKFNVLANLKIANPTPEEQRKIEEIEAQLIAEQEKLLARMNDVPGLLAAGSYIEAQKLLVQLEDNSSALPESDVNKLIQYISERNDLEQRVLEVADQAEGALVGSLDVDVISQAVTAAADLETKYNALPVKARYQTIAKTFALIEDSLAEETAEGQVTRLKALDMESEELNMALVAQRLERLEIMVKSAANRLETIRKQARDGSIDEAVVSLNSYINNQRFFKTVSMIEAKNLLSSLEERMAKNEEVYQEFEKAIVADDVEKVSKLLPQLEQKVLPFVISSAPSGAKIYLNGKDTGKTTPQLYPPATNAERAEMSFSIEKKGYHIATLSPLSSESSWRIRAVLQRKPIAEAKLEESVSSAVSVIGDNVWLSSNKSVWKIAQDGTSTAYELPAGVTTIYSPAAQAGNSVYVASRDRVVVKIETDGKVSAIPVSASSDSAVRHFISPVMLDSELLILLDAGNGSVIAVNEVDQKIQWTVPHTDRAACSPVLINDRLLVLYSSGECKTIDVNNGDVLKTDNLGSAVLSAWIEGDAIVALADKHLMSWDGKSVTSEPLFKDIVNGGPGVIKTKDNRIRTANNDGRFDIELGRLTAELTGQPLLWNGHAVCPVGNTMHIIGPRGFTIDASKPMLPPALLGDLLIVASSDGTVRFLKQ